MGLMIRSLWENCQAFVVNEQIETIVERIVLQ